MKNVPDAVLAAMFNKLGHLSQDVEKLVRAMRSYLEEAEAMELWRAQRILLQLSKRLRPGPVKPVELPEKW